MKKLSLIIIVLSLAACGSSNSKMSKDKFVVENLTNYNAEELKANYPEANILEDTGMFEEGTVERAYTVMYPNTPDELHITWKDKNRTRIEDIRMGSNGKWKSKTAIKIGSSYEELTQMNQKPISFYGFGWDYSGAVQWNDGKLEKSNVHVFLAPEKEPKNKFYGDQIVKATPEEIKELDLKVKAILFKP